MTTNDLMRLLHVGSKPIIISRMRLNEYGGIYREIAMFDENLIRVDYYGASSLEESAVSIHFRFENFDITIKALETYLSQKIDSWAHINYPLERVNEYADWGLFKNDFYTKKLVFPSLYSEMRIGSYYWKLMYNGYITPNATFDEIDKCIREYVKNEYDSYTE